LKIEVGLNPLTQLLGRTESWKSIQGYTCFVISSY
jgi:hypothetical protein